MKELLEAGVHFGHQTRRWNPKMKEYIFGERNGIHIIDLQKTLKMFREASRFVGELSGQGRTVLFVGTKRQAQEAVAEEAKRCGAFFVNHRWLGGTLTRCAPFACLRRRLRIPCSKATTLTSSRRWRIRKPRKIRRWWTASSTSIPARTNSTRSKKATSSRALWKPRRNLPKPLFLLTTRKNAKAICAGRKFVRPAPSDSVRAVL